MEAGHAGGIIRTVYGLVAHPIEFCNNVTEGVIKIATGAPRFLSKAVCPAVQKYANLAARCAAQDSERGRSLVCRIVEKVPLKAITITLAAATLTVLAVQRLKHRRENQAAQA